MTEIQNNISALNTSYTALTAVKKAFGYADYAEKLHNVMANAIEARNHKDLLLHHLSAFETLVRFEIPLPARPELFRKLNNLLSHMSLTFADDHKLCLVFLNLIGLVKAQIDAKEHTTADGSETEWEELQRSVFLLSNWEDFLTCHSR